jgi:hypothetical protein
MYHIFTLPDALKIFMMPHCVTTARSLCYQVSGNIRKKSSCSVLSFVKYQTNVTEDEKCIRNVTPRGIRICLSRTLLTW